MLDKLNVNQLQETAILLGIPVAFVRKDYFVTQAIQILMSIHNDYYGLVFQGGTSLAKAYQVVQRLSEDVDFRVIQKPAVMRLGKEARRKKLREFRHDLINSLINAGFKIPDNAIRVIYEGRFMRIRAEFEESDKLTYLKPHVAIECFLGALVLEPQTKEITTLIKTTIGKECDHLTLPVNCVALDETAAEKWVALTRRIANTKIKSLRSDHHLVRHLYDLYHLNVAELLTGEYVRLIKHIMEKDRNQFKDYNPAYTENPVKTSALGLEILFNDPTWKDHWHYFLEHMVYEQAKPGFDTACDHLREISQKIFKVV